MPASDFFGVKPHMICLAKSIGAGHSWLLQPQRFGLRRAHAKRLRACFEASRVRELNPLVIPTCPFVNLPETRKARWGEALTAGKMKRCEWVRPEVVAQLKFLEWTDADNLRQSKFVGMRDDKDARTVVKEQSGHHSG